MTFTFTLLIVLGAINLIHLALTRTSKYTIPFLYGIWFQYLLRDKDYVAPRSKIKTKQEKDIAVLQYACSVVFWNLVGTMAVIAWPLSIVRFVFLAVFVFVFYINGLIEMDEERRIAEYYNDHKNDEVKQDYQVRNIDLAKAVINLEREVARLKKLSGEPMKKAKKSSKPNEWVIP